MEEPKTNLIDKRVIDQIIRNSTKLITILGLVLIGTAGAIAQVTVSPTSINYGSVSVGLTSGGQSVTVTNKGTSNVKITALSFSLPVFHLTDGLVVTTLTPGESAYYTTVFTPGAGQTYSGQATLTVGGTNYTTTLTGTGTTTTAAASISSTSINFGNVAVGSAGTQNVTVTNTGASSLTISNITSYMPFTVGGFTTSVTLQAGQSFTFQISYNATATGTNTGWLNITYNVLPAGGVSLTGTGVAPTSLALTNYPSLPSAIQGDSYLATLIPTGGKSPYQMRVTSGSLPSGLTLSEMGATVGQITGTVASTVAVGNYTVTLQVRDSSTPTKQSITPSITIPVAAPTGANCNQIDVDIVDTTTPITALNDLGTGTYLGYEGGLYPDGSNVDPSTHESSGVSIAQAIEPLDANGTPDPTNGVEIFLSIGVSAFEQPFDLFIPIANADPAKNPKVVIVNGAQGSEEATQLASSTSAFWTQILDYLIPEAICSGAPCSPNQVVAAWVGPIDSTKYTFPTDATTLQGQIESTAQNLHTFFPNLVLAYFSSLNYTGYSIGVSTINPEPQAYDSGFGVQLAIADQINGDPNLNFNPSLGPVKAPWMAWGPYYWANGLLARSDGTTWSCVDLKSDGTHPSDPSGQDKVASFLLNFLKTDPTATPWFLAP